MPNENTDENTAHFVYRPSMPVFLESPVQAGSILEPEWSAKEEEECLHPWAKMDQAARHLPPMSLSILVGLKLKLHSLCIIVNVVENIWTFWFDFIFSVLELIAWKGLF